MSTIRYYIEGIKKVDTVESTANARLQEFEDYIRSM
jgi:hypothetical protein